MGEDIMASISWWFKAEQHGLWLCALQAEKTEVLGWLLYSTREMNIASLTGAIESQSGFEVGLWHRIILLGRPGPIPTNQRVYAIHVEVDAAIFGTAKRWFSKTYGTDALSDFPNGIKLRLVPELNSRTSAPMKVKIERLHARQAAFQSQVLRIDNWDITSIDFFDGDLQASLRELIMGIKSREKPLLPLFHSVDQHWQGTSYIFTVIPQFQQEAESILSGLLPFLQFCNPRSEGSLEKSFTVCAVERWADATWDHLNYCVRTLDDTIVQFILDGDHELDFSAFESDTNIGIASTELEPSYWPRPWDGQSASKTLDGNDADSVSTMGTRTSKSVALAGSKRKSVTFSALNSKAPPVSNMDSTNPADTIAGLSAKVDALTSQLAQLLQLQRPSPTATDTTETDHTPEQLMVSPDGAGSPRAAGAGSS